jgi:hypothetical protein
MPRCFLLAFVGTVWIMPLTGNADESAALPQPKSVVRLVRSASFNDAPSANATLTDRAQRQTAMGSGSLSDGLKIRSVSNTTSSSSDGTGVEPIPLPLSVPQAEAVQQVDGCETSCGDAPGCCETCSCGRGCGLGTPGEACCCRMPQHYAYFPPLHGYYYFRPYHPSHIEVQQQRVITWGGDPRNPYANEIFQTVYEAYRRDQQANQ